MSSRYDNPDYTDWQISMVNSTCRTTTRSVVLRYLEKHYSVVPWLPILDYGAGKKAAHTAYLRSIGFTDVTAFDIGRNFTPGVHSPDALQRKYFLVFASNVLNVQPNLSLLRETLEEIASVLIPGRGEFIGNYPSSPRKSKLSAGQVLREVERVFGTKPVLLGRKSSAPLFWVQRSL